MNRIRRVAITAAVALALCSRSAPNSFAIVLTPGTLLGVEAGNFPHELVSYSFSGSILDTLALSGLPSTPIGVAVIGNRVWVGGVAGEVGEVNLNTGVVSNLFNASSNEAIGDNGTNLLAYNYSDGLLREFTTAGGLLNTLQLTTGGTGIDGTNNRIYLGMYGGPGSILVYNTSGGLLNTIATGLPGNSVSALGFDHSNSTIWVATGFGDHRLRKYDLNGNLLANFPTNKPWINGLDVVSAVPEPASLTLAAVFLATMFGNVRQRGR